MGFPLMWLRLVGHATTIVAVISGGNLLNDARRRWLAYQERVRVLAPYPTPRPSTSPRSDVPSPGSPTAPPQGSPPARA